MRRGEKKKMKTYKQEGSPTSKNGMTKMTMKARRQKMTKELLKKLLM